MTSTRHLYAIWKKNIGHNYNWITVVIAFIFVGSACRIPPPESGMRITCLGRNLNQTVWLFNITADPYEENDVSDQYPDVVENLVHKLDQYYLDSAPVRYPPPDVNADPIKNNGLWGLWAPTVWYLSWKYLKVYHISGVPKKADRSIFVTLIFENIAYFSLIR